MVKKWIVLLVVLATTANLSAITFRQALQNGGLREYIEAISAAKGLNQAQEAKRAQLNKMLGRPLDDAEANKEITGGFSGYLTRLSANISDFAEVIMAQKKSASGKSKDVVNEGQSVEAFKSQIEKQVQQVVTAAKEQAPAVAARKTPPPPPLKPRVAAPLPIVSEQAPVLPVMPRSPLKGGRGEMRAGISWKDENLTQEEMVRHWEGAEVAKKNLWFTFPDYERFVAEQRSQQRKAAVAARWQGALQKVVQQKWQEEAEAEALAEQRVAQEAADRIQQLSIERALEDAEIAALLQEVENEKVRVIEWAKKRWQAENTVPSKRSPEQVELLSDAQKELLRQALKTTFINPDNGQLEENMIFEAVNNQPLVMDDQAKNELARYMVALAFDIEQDMMAPSAVQQPADLIQASPIAAAEQEFDFGPGIASTPAVAPIVISRRDDEEFDFGDESGPTALGIELSQPQEAVAPSKFAKLAREALTQERAARAAEPVYSEIKLARDLLAVDQGGQGEQGLNALIEQHKMDLKRLVSVWRTRNGGPPLTDDLIKETIVGLFHHAQGWLDWDNATLNAFAEQMLMLQAEMDQQTVLTSSALNELMRDATRFPSLTKQPMTAITFGGARPGFTALLVAFHLKEHQLAHDMRTLYQKRRERLSHHELQDMVRAAAAAQSPAIQLLDGEVKDLADRLHPLQFEQK